MKLPVIRPRGAADRPRSSAECETEIARLEAEHAAAAEQLKAMAVERVELLAGSGAIEDLLAFDARLAQVRIAHDRAAVQAERLEVERQAAEQREEGDRRSAIYERGRKAERDREKLMAGEYMVAAKALVAIVDRAHALTRTIEAANRELPAGAEWLGPGEPSNAVEHVPGHYRQLPPIEERFKRANGERLARGDTYYRGETYTAEVPQAPLWVHPIQGRAHVPVLTGLVVPDLSGRNLFPELGEAQR